MKTTGSLVKDTLRPDMSDVFSSYLLRYVQASAAEGVPVFALTLQNELLSEPYDYPGMRLDSPARARRADRTAPEAPAGAARPEDAAHRVEPQLGRAAGATGGTGRPGREPLHRGRRLALLRGRGAVAGAGRAVHDAYPHKDTWCTECSGGEWKPHWPETLSWMVRNIVIGSTRGWARGVLLWNLAFNENHGSHAGGCEGSRDVVTIDSRTGEVTRKLEYYALAHASKFVRPGARRVDSTAEEAGRDTVAFRNADDGAIALIVCNSAPDVRRMSVRVGGQAFAYDMPRESIATFLWKP